MANQIPQVRIKYAWLLSDVASVVLNEKYGDGSPLRPFEEYVEVAAKYREWWAPHNDTVLHGLCSSLNLEFRQNIIDVNVAPWFNSISDPLVIGPAFKSENSLINTLIHELIHRLITDNTSVDYEHDFLKDWKNLFGENHHWNTLMHIPVHATMKMLYLDILHRPDLLQLDQEETSLHGNKPYIDSWNYVNSHNYKHIVTSLGTSKQ